jgi:type IV secretory pathway VirB6-like protein
VGRDGGREVIQSQQRDSVQNMNNIERMQTQYNQEEVQLLNQDKQNDTLRYNFFYDVVNTKRNVFDHKLKRDENSGRKKKDEYELAEE